MKHVTTICLHMLLILFVMYSWNVYEFRTGFFTVRQECGFFLAFLAFHTYLPFMWILQTISIEP